jgi:hypothetical protein
MNTTTPAIRRPARASLALATAAVVLLGAAACGSGHPSVQDEPKAAPTPTAHATSPADTSGDLVDGAKQRYADRGRPSTANPDGDGQESPVLPPDGRPVPLPGQTE